MIDTYSKDRYYSKGKYIFKYKDRYYIKDVTVTVTVFHDITRVFLMGYPTPLFLTILLAKANKKVIKGGGVPKRLS